MKKPKSYYSHKYQADQAINENLEIVETIGEGAFGKVFKVFDHSSSELKVVKRHKQVSSKNSIDKENQIMKMMSGSQGFAKVKNVFSVNSPIRQSQISFFTKHMQTSNANSTPKLTQEADSEQLLVMECLGDNLAKIVEKKPISIYSMKRIACQLIQRLRQLHGKQYVHRDLKPENVLLGNQLNSHKIYLVDFGLVANFRTRPQKIRKMYQGLIGTARFCPLASHYGLQQFPKDDLQSLVYNLIFLVQGKLPWKFNHQIEDGENFQKMKKMKENIRLNELTGGITCLNKLYTKVKSYKAQDNIDYEELLKYFETDSKEQFCFQFCKSQCKHKSQRTENDDQQQNYIPKSLSAEKNMPKYLICSSK